MLVWRCAALAAALTLGLSAPARGDLVVSDVCVVDPRSEASRCGQTVTIRGERIAAIEPAAAALRIENAEVIDGRGAYLIPAFADAHTHVHDGDDLSLLLLHGVTRIRVLDGGRADLRRRDGAREDPARAWPRLQVCQQIEALHRANEAAGRVAAARSAGYDCLKLYSPPTWPLETYFALVRAARDAGFDLGGHLPRNLAFAEIAGEAQAWVAHLEEFLYAFYFREDVRSSAVDATPRLVERIAASGATVVTTLDNYRTIGLSATPALAELAARSELALMPAAVRREWTAEDNRNRRRLTPEQGRILLDRAVPKLAGLLRALVAEGVPVVLGTDTSRHLPFMVPGAAVHRELAAMVAAGLTPAEALRTATVDASKFLGEERTGLVEAGWRADLVLLAADPLTDIAATREIRGVARDGVWFSGEELARLRARVLASRR